MDNVAHLDDSVEYCGVDVVTGTCVPSVEFPIVSGTLSAQDSWMRSLFMSYF
jgi:hypothetical protein